MIMEIITKETTRRRLKILPFQLNKKDLGFVKLRKKSKIPFEKEWQRHPYDFNEINSWIVEGNNYGVCGGYGGLVILDSDEPELFEKLQANLPNTFIVKSPGKGYHTYLYCEDIENKIVLSKDGIHYGELMSYGTQVVGVGSIHPDTGTKYKIFNNAKIATVTKEDLLSVLSEYIPLESHKKDLSVETNEIDIMDILNTSKINLNLSGEQLIGSHPVHGSTNNNNFSVNPKKNVWHCFRCSSGGGAIMLIAVLENIIDCKDAKPSSLPKDKYIKTLEVAEKKYGIQLKHKFDDKHKLLTEEDISLLEQEIRKIPEDTPPSRIPILINPVLEKLSTINIAQANAILKDFIKTYFSFSSDDIKSYENVLKEYRKKQMNTSNDKSLRSDNDIKEALNNDSDIKTIAPAQDFKDGNMFFAVNIIGIPYLITSGKQVLPFDKIEKEGISLTHKNVNITRFSNQGILNFLEDKPINCIDKIYLNIREYVRTYIYFTNTLYLDFITLWVIGTYLFMIFRYYPYIWLHAEKSSGKTLMMEVLSSIVFNGELLTSPTEAVIFRDVANNQITMLIDEVEQFKKQNKECFGSLISILNVGFNKSGRVKRVERNSEGEWVTKPYNAYSPKMLAGINEIDDVLRDRTIPILLLRKKDTEIVKRYKETENLLKQQISIRDDLYTFSLIHAKEIAERYNNNFENELNEMSHLTNREHDIWEPIFIIAKTVDKYLNNSNLTKNMEDLSKIVVKEKQSDNVDSNETYMLLTVLKLMIDDLDTVEEKDGLLVFDADKVLVYFQKTDYFEWIEKKNSLTTRLKKVRVISKQARYDAQKIRVYEIRINEFQDFCERYKI